MVYFVWTKSRSSGPSDFVQNLQFGPMLPSLTVERVQLSGWLHILGKLEWRMKCNSRSLPRMVVT